MGERKAKVKTMTEERAVDRLARQFLSDELYASERRSLIERVAARDPSFRQRYDDYVRQTFPPSEWRTWESRLVGDDPYFELGVWFNCMLIVRFAKRTVAAAREGRRPSSLDVVTLRISLSGRRGDVPQVESSLLHSVSRNRERWEDGSALDDVPSLELADYETLSRGVDEFLADDLLCGPSFGDDHWWDTRTMIRQELLQRTAPLARLTLDKKSLGRAPSLQEICAVVLVDSRATWELRSKYRSVLPPDLVELVCASLKYWS